MADRLTGTRIAFLATDGVEQVELTEPLEAARREGAEVDLLNIDNAKIQGFNHLDKADTFPVQGLVSDADPDDYDGLVLPGGVANPDRLRTDADAVAFVRAFFDQDKPVAAICHGPWTIVEAGCADGRTLTSWPSLRTDIENAGGKWVDEELHVDGNLATSRKPDDLPAFCNQMVKMMAQAGARSR
ncbi:MAG: type 1 glutamine amidotransferase domain-containing protein [Gaiellales bacterium]